MLSDEAIENLWMMHYQEDSKECAIKLVRAALSASTEAAEGDEDPVAYVCEHATHPGDYTRLVSFEQTDHSKDFVCRPLFYGAPVHSVLRKALEHIVEYWNRDRNEDAMYDAIEHMIETAAQALESEAETAVTSEQTAVYDTEYVREKFADYQSQIDGLKEELEFVRKTSSVGSNPHHVAGYMRASKLAHSIEASKRSVKHVVNDDNSIDVVTLPWGHWALLAANVELLLEWVFEEDQCHCPVKQAAGEQRLEKPAKVGGVRFREGVRWSTVIEAAQRLYEYEVTPEKEVDRIERAQETVAYIRTGKTRPGGNRPIIDEDGLIGSAIDGDALIEAVFNRTIPFTYKSFGRALLAEWPATPKELTVAGGENASLTEEDKRDLEEARKSLQCFSMSTEPVDMILARRSSSKDPKCQAASGQKLTDEQRAKYWRMVEDLGDKCPRVSFDEYADALATCLKLLRASSATASDKDKT